MTDSTVTAKPSLKPEHLTMEEWVESRIARFEGRKYDWNALKFQADFDPKYRRAQMRYIGTGATGVASDSNTVQAEHFTFSTMVLPSKCEGPLHLLRLGRPCALPQGLPHPVRRFLRAGG